MNEIIIALINKAKETIREQYPNKDSDTAKK